MRMSMSGWRAGRPPARGISHIEAKLAQVVMATLLRPALWRIWRTVRPAAPAPAAGAQQLGAGAGQFHRARVAQEQRHADLVFQRLDLAADGRLGQRQLVGRGAEVQVPGHGLEGAQADGDRAAAQVGDGGAGFAHGCAASRFMRGANQSASWISLDPLVF
jgi:hypothetical protein